MAQDLFDGVTLGPSWAAINSLSLFTQDGSGNAVGADNGAAAGGRYSGTSADDKAKLWVNASQGWDGSNFINANLRSSGSSPGYEARPIADATNITRFDMRRDGSWIAGLSLSTAIAHAPGVEITFEILADTPTAGTDRLQVTITNGTDTEVVTHDDATPLAAGDAGFSMTDDGVLLAAFSTTDALVTPITITGVAPSASEESGTELTLTLTDADNAAGKTASIPAGALTVASQTLTSVVLDMPDPLTFGDQSLNFNAPTVLTIDDAGKSGTTSITVEPTAGYDFAQITALTGIYAGVSGLSVGDYAYGRFLAGSGTANLAEGLFTNAAAATYEIYFYDGNWGTAGTVTLDGPAAPTVVPTITPTAGVVISQSQGVTYSDPAWTWADDVASAQSVSWSGDTVNINSPGIYVRTATATNAIGTTTLDYTVTITTLSASVAPTITPTSGVSISVEEGSSYADPAWTWADDVVSNQAVSWGGDIVDINTPGVYVRVASATNAVSTTQLNYTITVTESSVVTQAPTINPTSGDVIRVIIGSAYTDPAWTWSDNVVSGQAVTWSGSAVNTAVLGSYTRAASGTNTIGTTDRDLTINVINQPSGSGSGSVIGTL